MSKETQPKIIEKTPPSVIFQNLEKNGFDHDKYKELKSRAVADIAELQDPAMLQLVEERINNMMAAIPTDSVNTFIDLALRHRPAVNSMLNGYVRDIKREIQKHQARLH